MLAFSSGSLSFLRSTTAEADSTRTSTPSSPTSTMARANSGPLSMYSVGLFTASTMISLMQTRMPAMRNGSATICRSFKVIRTA